MENYFPTFEEPHCVFGFVVTVVTVPPLNHYLVKARPCPLAIHEET